MDSSKILVAVFYTGLSLIVLAMTSTSYLDVAKEVKKVKSNSNNL